MWSDALIIWYSSIPPIPSEPGSSVRFDGSRIVTACKAVDSLILEIEQDVELQGKGTSKADSIILWVEPVYFENLGNWMLISLAFSVSSDRQGAGKNRAPAMHVDINQPACCWRRLCDMMVVSWDNRDVRKDVWNWGNIFKRLLVLDPVFGSVWWKSWCTMPREPACPCTFRFFPTLFIWDKPCYLPVDGLLTMSKPGALSWFNQIHFCIHLVGTQ